MSDVISLSSSYIGNFHSKKFAVINESGVMIEIHKSTAETLGVSEDLQLTYDRKKMDLFLSWKY
ncbi:hypothetical protein J1TS3_33910 [Siminovitchia fordii]|uniref:Uncharacterized protein n=1 Tax=Siminovitchia fordii TaxID=254759 RepID=A0ABQ4K963_9BACI|nr:hypothetical protein J1TS3_33910 [Siminovitchia fordii]